MYQQITPMVNNKRALRPLVAAITASVAVLALQGCAIAPKGVGDYNLNKMPNWLQSHNEPLKSAPPIEFKQTKWWQAVHDPILSELIDQALKDNASLRAADARTRAAMAQIGVLHADELPQVGTHLDLNKQKLSKNYYVPPPFSGVSMEQGVATLNLGWNIDLWGRQAKAIEAVEGQVKAAEAERAMVALKLSTDIAKVYVQIRWVGAYIDQLQAIKALNQQMVDLQKTRLDLGLDNGNGLDRANDALAQTELLLNQAEGQKARYIAATESLVGDTAVVEKAVAALPKTLPDPILNYSPEQPIALSLLARRPDLVGQRFMVQSAAAEVDTTRLAALPNINLNGYIGNQSIGWSKLTEPDSRVSLLGGVVDFPIFDGGKVKFATAEKKAKFDELKAQYEGSITSAAQQVISEVILLKQLNEEIQSQEARTASLENLTKRARQRRELGIDSSMPAIEAELALRTQQTRLLQTKLQALDNQVDLVEALGGGYENKDVLTELSSANTQTKQ
ncbi:efflux transporter outer membrane subunit [Limnobacter sp.]|uniref:efflux transporter outer membrane subunit n=2 Tax=Limnobacter sp. TaxID=2003368 RepID=UPI002E2EF073|nr:efflux transporter outer membrane subunit [Limnobacter sp.]